VSFEGDVEFGPFDGDRLGDRSFANWPLDLLEAVVVGAGFTVAGLDRPRPGWFAHRLVRERTLPDFVGPDLRLLVVGLNPSLHAADAGVGYVTPSNRFWRAASAAGLVSVDRDPWHALDHHRLGMTDVVKRATPRAAELTTAEYRAGLDRLERLVAWLTPGAVCFVGLAGWRAAVDRQATAGIQPRALGGRPVYVSPSTSGLNATTSLDDLVEHLRAAAALADAAARDA
jgi:TDG/mug DNA glycosylase family protein